MPSQFPIRSLPYEEIAEKVGTPYYAYDAKEIRDNFQALRSNVFPQLEIFYSLKANPNISLVGLLHSMGAGTEVCSLTEFRTVLRAGVDPKNIIFVGPAKSDEELQAAIEVGIYAIICESLTEFRRIETIAQKLGKRPNVTIRVNPKFSAKEARLTMGGKPRQFGMDQDTFMAELPGIADSSHIEFMGIHVYMGTRILSATEVGENTQNILNLAEEVKEMIGRPLQMVDIGGGLGVPYFEKEDKIDVRQVGTEINPHLAAFADRNPGTRLIMELGRYLIATSGTLVMRARDVKESMGQKFIVADGGTNCHMAAVGIGSFVKRNFPIVSLTHPEAPEAESYNLAGPLCTPNDIVGKALRLPEVKPGDLLGVLQSGAYGPTASPVNFLSFGFPAEVLVDGKEIHVIRERDEPEDLLRKQRLVEFKSERKGE